MAVNYLRDVSNMVAIVSALRTGNTLQQLQVERRKLNLVFAFDHIVPCNVSRFCNLGPVNFTETARQDCMGFVKTEIEWLTDGFTCLDSV